MKLISPSPTTRRGNAPALTPALSLGRGGAADTIVIPRSPSASATDSAAAQPIHARGCDCRAPSPWGEGRGEGGQLKQSSSSRSSYLLPLLLAALFISLAAGCATQKPAPVAQADAKPLPFEKEILAFEAADRTNPPPRGAILFIGSSSIRLWKTLAQDFPNHRVINRGFGGSQISDSIRYADRIVLPYEPRQIILYAGGNDINAKKTPEQVFADYCTFVARVHAKLPRTRIAYISIAPNPARWAQVGQVRRVNQMIANHTKTDRRLTYIDTFTHMLGPDGRPLPDIYLADRLHMNAKGYELWKGIVGPVLLP